MEIWKKAFIEEGFSLDRLRRLIEVENAGYIAKAAAGDRILANQISRQISELEDFFGKTLRKKEGKLAKLNDRGSELAAITGTFFKRLEEFQNKLDGGKAILVLGAGQAYIENFLIPGLPVIQKSLPDLKIKLRNLTTHQIRNGLESGDLDLGILSSRTKLKPKFKTSKLFSFGYQLFVPRSWEDKVNKKNPIDSIFSLPFAVLEGSGELSSQINHYAQKKGKLIEPEIECSSLAQIATAIRTGVCCGILPSYMKDSRIDAKAKSYDLEKLKTLRRTILIAWKPTSPRIVNYLEDAAFVINNLFKGFNNT